MSSLNLSAEERFNEEYIIGPNDVIEIKIWDNIDLDRTVEVSQEGSFTMPLIGKIYAGGLSVFEVENLIKKRLANGYLVAPQVSIALKQYKSQKVFLFGEVKRPGSYFLKKKTHILELISEAGGFTDTAGRKVTIVRNKSLQKSGEPISRDANEEAEIIMLDLGEFDPDSRYDIFFVESGDSIYISKIQRFFVTGEVRKPGEFKWEEGLSVRQAISLAGGPKESASLKRTKFIRVDKKGKEKEIRASMDDLVRSEDIIIVSERYF